MIYAYLRVSTTLQDEENQRTGVDKKAKELGVKIDKYVIDKVSGVTDYNQRNLGKMIKKLQEDDIIIISELSRLSRRVFMLFEIIKKLIEKNVHVYSVKDGYVLENSIQSKVLAFAFGLAAEIERDLISARTKEALAHRRAMGTRLGRPVGAKNKASKLDLFKEKILKAYHKGDSVNKLRRKYKVCNKTMKDYLEKILIEEIDKTDGSI